MNNCTQSARIVIRSEQIVQKVENKLSEVRKGIQEVIKKLIHFYVLEEGF